MESYSIRRAALVSYTHLDVYKRQVFVFDFCNFFRCCGNNPYALIAHAVKQRVELPDVLDGETVDDDISLAALVPLA